MKKRTVLKRTPRERTLDSAEELSEIIKKAVIRYMKKNANNGVHRSVGKDPHITRIDSSLLFRKSKKTKCRPRGKAK